MQARAALASCDRRLHPGVVARPRATDETAARGRRVGFGGRAESFAVLLGSPPPALPGDYRGLPKENVGRQLVLKRRDEIPRAVANRPTPVAFPEVQHRRHKDSDGDPKLGCRQLGPALPRFVRSGPRPPQVRSFGAPTSPGLFVWGPDLPRFVRLGPRPQTQVTRLSRRVARQTDSRRHARFECTHRRCRASRAGA